MCTTQINQRNTSIVKTPAKTPDRGQPGAGRRYNVAQVKSLDREHRFFAPVSVIT